MAARKTPRALVQAVTRSQTGDVEGALRLLEDLATEGVYEPDAEGFRFLLLRQLGRSDDAIAVADASLEQPLEPLARSTWLLRRGLIHLEFERHLPALSDLQEVLKLKATPDHEDQARAALVRISLSGRVQ